MARTRFQQYQVSGSLLADINDSLTVGSGLQGKSDITGDLNAIRTQLNKIIGTGHWYDALTGSQSLKVINDAMSVSGNDVTFNDKVNVVGSLTSSLFRSTGDAVFQNNVNVQNQLTASLFRSTGDAVFATNVNVVGQLTASQLRSTGDAVFATNVNVVGQLTSSQIRSTGDAVFATNVNVVGQLTASQIRSTGDAVFQSNVNVQNQLTASSFRTLNNANVDGQLTASYLNISGSSVFNGPVVFSGSVEIPSSFEIAGDMFVLSGTFDMSGSAYFTGGSVNVAGPMTASTLKITGDTEMSGNLKLESGDSLFIADLNAQEVLFAAAGGELTGSSKFLWNNAGSQLTVLGGISGSGNFATGGTLTVAGASDLNGALDVAGQVDLAAAGVATNIRGTLDVKQDAVFSGSVKLEAGDSLFIGDLNAQEIVFAAAAGELSGSSKLLWNNAGSQLTVLGGVSGSGAFNVGSTLTVAGAADLNSSLDVSGQVDLAAAGVATNIRGTLDVKQDAVFSGSVKVESGDSLFIGDLNVQEIVFAAAGGELSGSSKLLWDNSGEQLTVLGGVSGSGAFNVGSTLTVAAATDLNSSLDVAGQVDLAASGIATNIRGTLDVKEDTVFSGSVRVEYGDSLYIADLNAQELVFAAADGELTGSGKLLWDNSGEQLTVLGGVSGSGNFLVGGQLEVAGTSQFNDVVEVLAPLTASSMKVLGQAEFMGAVYFNGTMVNSEQIVSGNFAVSGNTDLDGGNLTVHRDLLANNLYDLNNDKRVSFVHGEDFQIFTDGGYAALTLDKTNGNVTLTDDLIFGGVGNSGSIRVAANNTDLELVSTGKLFITASGQAFNFANSGEQALFSAQFPGLSLIGAMLAGGGNLKQAVVAPGNTTGGVDLINFSGIGYLRSGSIANDTEKMNAMNVYLNGALLAYGASNDYEVIDTANIRLVSGIDTLSGDVMIISIKNAAN